MKWAAFFFDKLTVIAFDENTDNLIVNLNLNYRFTLTIKSYKLQQKGKKLWTYKNLLKKLLQEED